MAEICDVRMYMKTGELKHVLKHNERIGWRKLRSFSYWGKVTMENAEKNYKGVLIVRSSVRPPVRLPV